MDLKEFEQKMGKALDFLREELAQVKTGRATPALVERIMVEAYETKMPLVELATIVVPDPNELVITPFDKTILPEISRAISQRKEAGLSPVADGQLIRIKIPPLTGERREELARLLGQKLEVARIAIRQIRQDARTAIKDEEDQSLINEDEEHRLEEQLQSLVDKMNEKIKEIGENKRAEILGE